MSTTTTEPHPLATAFGDYSAAEDRLRAAQDHVDALVAADTATDDALADAREAADDATAEVEMAEVAFADALDNPETGIDALTLVTRVIDARDDLATRLREQLHTRDTHVDPRVRQAATARAAAYRTALGYVDAVLPAPLRRNAA